MAVNKRQKKRRLMSDINVVPYIDVTLVLLIIFMITSPLQQQGVEVDLPDADAATIAEQYTEDPLILSVDKDGLYYLNIGNENNDKPVALDKDTLVQRAATVIKHRKNIAVMVRGDSQVPYEHVVYGMTLLQAAGARSIGLLTDPPE